MVTHVHKLASNAYRRMSVTNFKVKMLIFIKKKKRVYIYIYIRLYITNYITIH